MTTKFFFAGLMVYFVSSISGYYDHLHHFLHNETTLKYRIEGARYLKLLPEGKKTEIKVSGYALVRRINGYSNDLAIAFKDVEITADQKSGEKIDIAKCLARFSPLFGLEQPFIVIIDHDGAVQDIRINPYESEMVVNFKWGLAVQLHLDIPQLLGKAPQFVERRRETFAGMCPKKSVIVETNQTGIVVGTAADLAPCILETSKQATNELTCMGNTYRHPRQGHLVWTDNTVSDVRITRGHFAIQKWYHEELISYNPYVDSDIKLTDRFTVLGYLVSVNDEQIPLAELYRCTRPIKKLIAHKINNDICNNNYSWKNNDLRQLYSAVSVDLPTETISHNIIESAIMCEEFFQP